MQKSSRAEGLDGLRGLAATAIVLLHVWMFSGAHQSWQSPGIDEVIGTFGVALMAFFVLSGYLIAGPWLRAARGERQRPHTRPYAWRRAARILPAYVACVLGSFVLMRAIDHPLAVEFSELPAFLVFAHNQLEATGGQLNPPLWSLSIEMSLYLLMPLLGAAMIPVARRLPRTGIPLILTSLTLTGLLWTAIAVQAGEPRALINALPTYLPIFACGIAAAWWLAGRTEPLAPVVRGGLLALGAALVYFDAAWHAGGTGQLGHVVRDLPAGAGFALIVAAVAGGGGRLLSARPLVLLGAYSYGIYLWHMPVLYWLRHAGHWPVSPWEAFAQVFTVSLALGAVSWHLLERPINSWAARRTGPRQLPLPARATATAPGQRRSATDSERADSLSVA